MTDTDRLLLDVLAAAVHGADYTGPIDADAAPALFAAAELHGVLPLTAEALYRRPELAGSPAMAQARSNAVEAVMRQLRQDNELLVLIERLRGRGFDPLVVKGLACRAVYPKPHLRPSTDEDILVPSERFAACAALLPSLGLTADFPDADLSAVHETSFHKPDSPLYIELHGSLFPPDAGAFAGYDAFFGGVFDSAGTITVQGLPLGTPAPTEHMLYLILHACKHFVYSGFGIRQVCDIALYAEAYGAVIDWRRVTAACDGVRAGTFAAAVFGVARQYLAIDPPALPAAWRDSGVDILPLLDDILTGGLYGTADESRLHSASITLTAAADRAPTLRAALFPSARSLETRYPCLQKHPVLLPAVWVYRAARYALAPHARRRAAESVRIGRKRVDLLRLYQIRQEM